jgi:propionate CoA-transferase
LWTSLESGVIGGVPTDHANFGVASNPAAIIRHDDQFSFYNGGGVDLSVLGFAEIDAAGAINVSRFGTTFTGGGGFIDICARTKQLVFCGMFDAGGKVELKNGKITVAAPGKAQKLVSKVNQVTFSGHHAVRDGRGVSLVTERAVFELHEGGWHLIEVAPGVRVKEDVIDRMGFAPIVGRVHEMDAALFTPAGT